MQKALLILGIIFLVLAVVIFVFADGLRRYYSGGFFLVIGIACIANALRSPGKDKET